MRITVYFQCVTRRTGSEDTLEHDQTLNVKSFVADYVPSAVEQLPKKAWVLLL